MKGHDICSDVSSGFLSIEAFYPQIRPGAELGKTQKGGGRSRIPSKEGIDFPTRKAIPSVLKEITEAAKVESTIMKDSI